ncbi:MAG TPA: alanine--tRNA ligase [Thermomicrobiales bacterium]|nr:alanine--tRNA ligase [Thermomicrobiales bacterium]
MSSDAQSRPSHGHRYMTGAEVRAAFVSFFESKGHREVPSSSLVPINDPTVLLTTAGMQQMTPYFLGLETPPHNRLCSVQKCFRTVDIEEVGDESHCTFFFMLGNFSIGDYFKRESLAWSWEFLTEVLGLPAERLYPTVHPDDTDAYAIWRDEIGVPEERIGKLADNWWGPVGNTGPNGPDSEIYFDLGPEAGDTGEGPGDGSRYLEVWNNVFMEFFQAPDGSRTPLPKQHVDTGMGLERLTMIMQGAKSIYDIDLYQAIIGKVASEVGVTYGMDEKVDRSLRVVADHIRGGTFLIADGVLPGNEGRSYVLRRILRRAIKNGRQLGIDKPFLSDLAEVVIAQFADNYPELRERRSQIIKVLNHEEQTFRRTLSTGMGRFQALADSISATGGTVVPGDEVFRLYDTYGFPADLTRDLAEDAGLSIDSAGFETAMQAQREASRAGGAFKDTARHRAEMYVHAAGQKTEFLGYDTLTSDATIVALIGPGGVIDVADAGETVEVVLDRTPFYGESGGQIGDTGRIRTDTGLIDIDDTVKPTPDLFVHRGVVAEGFIRAGETVTATVDGSRRRAVQRNHTATHLLHKALRMVLGDETHQAGSLVAPDRLRFDFTSLESMASTQVERVAEIVNAEILEDRPVDWRQMPMNEAVAEGAMALFGEKYGDVVRVVDIEGFSKELCGGTHVGHTGEIGPFLIVSEGSVAAGVRRIEALTGSAATNRMLAQQRLLDRVSRDLRTTWHEVPEAIALLQERTRATEREMAALRGKLTGSLVDELLHSASDVAGVPMIAQRVAVGERGDLRQLADRLRDRQQSGVVVLGAVFDDKPALLAMVSPDLVSRGLKAGDIIREIAQYVEGRGGGRPDLAEAGGKNAAGLDEALLAVSGAIEAALEPST